MSNYTKSTNFTAKDSLPTGDTNKVIRGTEFDTEFDAIATAVGTKSDLAGPTFTGTATFANLTATGTVNLTGATVSNLGTVTTVDINGGTIDGATIGASSASTGNFTTLSINGTAITSTAAELNILDGVTASTAEINLLDGVTSTTAELNILDGVTATAVELNALDGITASTAELNLLDGVTATTAELNYVDGVTSNIQTQLNAKGTVSSLSDLGVTSTAAELNTLDGITSSTAELNLLDGVTATTAELNILDGVTSTAAELNILDGKAFLDEDDLSSNSATGIPSQQSVKAYVDSQTGGGGTTLSGLTDTNITSPADAALLFYDTGTSKWIDNVVSGDITIADTGVAAIGAGVIVNADISASAAIDISKLNGVTSTAAELNILDGVTATTAEINILDGVTATTAELNILDGVTSTAAELNILDGVTSTAAELNLLDGSTADTVVNSKAVIYGSSGEITANELDVDNIQINANAVKSTNTNGNIELFPNGTGTTVLYGNTNPGTIVFNCESNSHGVTLKGPAHSAASTYTVALPDTLGTTQASGVVTSDANGVVTFDNGISEEYKAVTSSSNATTVNLRDGTNFSHTLTENTTFTFSNPASSGKVSAFTLKIVQDASASGYTVTWPGSVDWPSATAPTLTATASAVDYFVFITHDGGTTYYGFTAGQALA
jgi:hypothetical protein